MTQNKVERVPIEQRIDALSEALSWAITSRGFPSVNGSRMTFADLLELVDKYRKRSGGQPDPGPPGLPTTKPMLTRIAQHLGSRDGIDPVVAILRHVRTHERFENRSVSAFDTFLKKHLGEERIPSYNEPSSTPLPVLRQNYITVEDRLGALSNADEVLEHIGTVLEQAARAVRITSAMVRAHDLNQQQAEDAAMYAEQSFERLHLLKGLSEVAKNPPETVKQAAKCARTAAWARVQAYQCMLRENGAELGSVDASRTAQEDEFLATIEKWKRHEAYYVELEGNEVAAAFARFHADRARALYEFDNHTEIRAIGALANTLCETAKSNMAQLHSSIYYHDLTSLISRLCAVDWAFSKVFKYEKTLAKAFPKGISDTISELINIYDPDDVPGKHQKASVQALLDIKEAHDAIFEAYEPSGRDKISEGRMEEVRRLVENLNLNSFLHAVTATNLTAISLARYAIASYDVQRSSPVAGSEKATPSSAGSDRNGAEKESDQGGPNIDCQTLLLTAEKACERALARTHNRGSGAFTRDRLEFLRRQIKSRKANAAPSERTEALQSLTEPVNRHVEQITTLVLTRGPFCTVDELYETQLRVTELASAVERFTRDITDPQESNPSPVESGTS